MYLFFFFKQKTEYELRISDWSSDVCVSDLVVRESERPRHLPASVGRAAADRRPVQHRRQPDRRRGPRSAAQARSARRGRWRGRVRRRPHLCRDIRPPQRAAGTYPRSEEHTSELQSLMRISYAVFCLKKKKKKTT